MATNYPVARLEGGGKVFYCRTAHHSTMAVATGAQPVTTILSVTASVPPGNYELVVVANGIPSDPFPVTIASALPALAVDIENGGDFGTVCDVRSLFLKIFNTGNQNLIVDQVFTVPSPGPFIVEPLPATPVTLVPGADIEFTVTFTPTTPGATETGIIRIVSNDPNNPVFDINISATDGAGTLATAIADFGDFGQACVGSFRDEPLTLANTGSCKLTILDITSSFGAFLPPSVQNYPLTIAVGTAIDLPIRFLPLVSGLAAADITVFSDDPAGPKVVRVAGLAPHPNLTLLIADTGNFGKVCVGEFVDKPLTLTNSGKCILTVTGITVTGEFLAPEVLSYPVTLGPGDALPIPIRFAPLSFGPKTGTITVNSDDPAGPRTIDVSGEAPPGRLVVSGSTSFGGVNACCCADRTIAICNAGECALYVTSVHFRRKSRHWRVLHNPFPAMLRPGSCFPLVIQYRATEKCPRACELVIESDDPATPVKRIDVMAYTIWDGCCRENCEDCRKGCCDKHRGESKCQQGYPCCCEEDEDEESS